jgi:hypothetical protein
MNNSEGTHRLFSTFSKDSSVCLFVTGVLIMKFYLFSLTLLFALIGCFGDAEPEIQNDEKILNTQEDSQTTSTTKPDDNLETQPDKPYWEDEENLTEKHTLDQQQEERNTGPSEDEEEAEYLSELDEQDERFSESER